MSTLRLTNEQEREAYPEVESLVLQMAPDTIPELEQYLAALENDHALHIQRAELTAGTANKVRYKLNRLRREAKEQANG